MSLTPFGKDNFFYESQIRQCVALFGSVFSDMYIKRGEDFLKLPIRYSGGYLYEKAPQTSETRESTKVLDVMPGLSYVFTTITKDPSRMTQRFIETEAGGNGEIVFGRVPYNITFSLRSRTKHLTEDLQILEQIAAVFAPSITIKVNPLANNVSESLQQETIVVLEDISELPEDYDTDAESKKYERDYVFTVKTYLYPRVQRSFVIHEVLLNTMLEDISETVHQQSVFDVKQTAENDAIASTVVNKVKRQVRKTR